MAKQTKSGLVDKSTFPFFVSLTGLLFFFMFFLTKGLFLPFVGFNAWNFNTYALIAHNYNQFGYKAVQLAPVISVSKTLPYQPEYYLHHPTLLYIVMGIVFRLIGESFWTARLPVLFASVVSLLLIVLIGTRLHNRLFGLFSGLAFILMPATVVFGRMIGHEAFILLFILLFVYFVLLYEHRREWWYLFGAFLAVILGAMSDWPMVYFIFLSFPYFFLKKQKKEWLGFFIAALATTLLFSLYIYFILGSFQDMQQAFLNRSTGALLHQSLWPVRWASVFSLRVFLYFTPLFVLFAVLYSVTAIKKKLYNDRSVLILIFFAFGIVHVLLYPEGSFGHPYWIYYLSPFFALSSGYVLYALWRRKYYFLMISCCIFSLVFFLKIENWKYKEMYGNLWRYSLMSKANVYLPAYEPVILNKDGVVDPDLIAYAFKHPITVQSSPLLMNSKRMEHYYLYSCLQQCGNETPEFAHLKSNYSSKKASTREAEMYIFDLSKPQRRDAIIQTQDTKKALAVTQKKDSVLRSVYIFLLSILSAPQI